jgi:hypothetical protein
VLAVPMFTGIRIHAGNTVKDTAGCLLVGQTRSVEARSIGRSRLAYNALMSKLTAAVEAGDTIHITYVNPKRCRRFPSLDFGATKYWPSLDFATIKSRIFTRG